MQPRCYTTLATYFAGFVDEVGEVEEKVGRDGSGEEEFKDLEIAWLG